MLGGKAASGQFSVAVSDRSLYLPYLAVAAVCTALVLYATRIPRGSS